MDAPLDIPTIDKMLAVKLADLATTHEKAIATTAARADAREADTKFRDTTPIRYLPVYPL